MNDTWYIRSLNFINLLGDKSRIYGRFIYCWLESGIVDESLQIFYPGRKPSVGGRKVHLSRGYQSRG